MVAIKRSLFEFATYLVRKSPDLSLSNIRIRHTCPAITTVKQVTLHYSLKCSDTTIVPLTQVWPCHSADAFMHDANIAG